MHCITNWFVVARWRACFPSARAANCSGTYIVDADFAHLVGIHTLSIRFCYQITDAAFAYLRGIHTLDMSYCHQSTITDAAFVHLAGIHTLDMHYCNPSAIAAAHALGLPVIP